MIEEYTTIVNPQKISGAISCYFEIITEPDQLMQVAELLNAQETITQIYRVSGKSRLHVHAVASSNEELERLMKETIDRLPGVLECSCHISFLQDQRYQGTSLIVPFLLDASIVSNPLAADKKWSAFAASMDGKVKSLLNAKLIGRFFFSFCHIMGH